MNNTSSQQKECLNVKTNTATRFQLDSEFAKFKYVGLSYVNFSINYKNISQDLKNNILYLSPSLQITIPDGTYSITDINQTILNTPISTFYYKIVRNLQSTSYDIYRYASFTDWQSNINGTNMNAPQTNINSLNYKLKQRPNLLEAFKIGCNLFDIHENNSTTYQITNELIIPIASTALSRNHYEPQQILFDNKINQSSEIQVEFLSLDNNPITFLETDPPNILFIFEN